MQAQIHDRPQRLDLRVKDAQKEPAECTVISKGRKAAGQHCRVVQEECS